MDRRRSGAAGQSPRRDERAVSLTRSRPKAVAVSLRSVQLIERHVEYHLVRSRRRSIEMTIDHAGLVVRAPRWAAIREIESALRERAAWVLETLNEWCGRDRDSLPTEWRAGAPLLFQGRMLTLALFAGRQPSIDADLLHLTVLHPAPGDEAAIAGLVGRWLREQALAQLAPRALHFARLIGTKPPKVKLSDARAQWGSCNHRGEIRLSWRLVQLPPRIADYVVAHEVAHLVELNHSRRFWTLVESLLPGHAAARRELDTLTPLLAA